MKVKIDKSKCLGCGSCVSLMPEMFEVSDDGLAQIKKDYIGKEITDNSLIERLRMAAESCPNGAIILE